MAKKAFLAGIICLALACTACSLPSEAGENYELYRTETLWTFLKLDTRTGIISQVRYSIEGDAAQTPLNSEPLAEGNDASPGRFALYPTNNIYSFMLLDRIDGRVWQVQWNESASARGIWEIN